MQTRSSALLVAVVAMMLCTTGAFHLPVPAYCNGPLPNVTRSPTKLFDNTTLAMLTTFHRLVAATPTVVKPTGVSFQGTATIAELYNRTQPLSDVVTNALDNITSSTATAAHLTMLAHDVTKALLEKVKNGTLPTAKLLQALQVVNKTLRSANAWGGYSALQASAAAAAPFHGMDNLVLNALEFRSAIESDEYNIKLAAHRLKNKEINETQYNQTVTKYEQMWGALILTRAANNATLTAMNGMFYPPLNMFEKAAGYLITATSSVTDSWRLIPDVLLVEKNRVLLAFKLDVLRQSILQSYEKMGWVVERICTNVYLAQ